VQSLELIDRDTRQLAKPCVPRRSEGSYRRRTDGPGRPASDWVMAGIYHSEPSASSWRLVDGEPACRRETAKCDSGVTPSRTQGCDLLLFKFKSPSPCEPREILSHDCVTLGCSLPLPHDHCVRRGTQRIGVWSWWSSNRHARCPVCGSAYGHMERSEPLAGVSRRPTVGPDIDPRAGDQGQPFAGEGSVWVEGSWP